MVNHCQAMPGAGQGVVSKQPSGLVWTGIGRGVQARVQAQTSRYHGVRLNKRTRKCGARRLLSHSEQRQGAFALHTVRPVHHVAVHVIWHP